VIAGGETAGIPFAAWLADRLDLPMVYVRKKPKGFGRGAQIEGEWRSGARMLLVEDLATDGGSKVTFIEAIRKAEAVVSHTLVVFHYGIFKASTETLAKLGVTLHGLATWHDVVAEAEASGMLKGANEPVFAYEPLCRAAEATDAQRQFAQLTEKMVRAYLAAPDAWSVARGGKG